MVLLGNVVFTSTNAATVNKSTGTAVVYSYLQPLRQAQPVWFAKINPLVYQVQLAVVLVGAMPMLGQDLIHFPHQIASLTVTNGATTKNAGTYSLEVTDGNE